MRKIVILDADTIGTNDELKIISNLGETEIYRSTNEDEKLKNIGNAEIIVTNKVLIDKLVIEKCPNLKLIAITATGVNNVDLEYAKSKNIIVKNVAGYSTESVAQHTFASLFYLMSNLKRLDEFVASGSYMRHPDFTNIQIPIEQIYGLTFGVIGMGAIGKRVAQIADCFGAKVQYYSTSGKNKYGTYPQKSLVELLQNSDIVSIHAPLNEQTENLISAPELAKMKSSAYLLNMGRGKIINEADLAEALKKGQIKAAALDVLEHEPMESGNPLLSLCGTEKLLICPHVAWAGNKSRKKLIEMVADNIKNFINSAL